MHTITPCLCYDGQAEAATRLYTSLLPDSRVGRVVRSPTDTPSGPGGSVLVVEFTLLGRPYVALNAGPRFKFTEAMSLQVHVDGQTEVDRLWAALTADGGRPSRCGWLTDKWGLSWQAIPRRMSELLADPDPARAGRAMRAMMGMTKLDVAELERAADLTDGRATIE